MEIPEGHKMSKAPTVISVTGQSSRGFAHGSHRSTKLRNALIAVGVLVALCILFIFTVHLLGMRLFKVEGNAMLPSYKNGQFLVTETFTYKFGSPRRGDVVTFWGVPAGFPNKVFIQRVIGLPGDSVSIHDGEVYIDGRRLREQYVARPATYSFGARKVPANDYFVLGDNRNNSFDSHKWASTWLARKYIIGKGWFLL